MRCSEIFEAASLKKFKVVWGKNQQTALGTVSVEAANEHAARKLARQQLEAMYFKNHGFKILYTMEVGDDGREIAKPVTEAAALAQPKPYEWVKQDDTNWEATFRFGDHGYWFNAYRTKGKIPPTYQLETLWVIQFGISKEDSVALAGHKNAIMNMTGLGKPFGIMATIRAIFEDFITQKRPEVIWFSDLHNSSGRKKLYDMATDLLVNKYGYEKDEAVMQYFAQHTGNVWLLRAPA